MKKLFLSIFALGLLASLTLGSVMSLAQMSTQQMAEALEDGAMLSSENEAVFLAGEDAVELAEEGDEVDEKEVIFACSSVMHTEAPEVIGRYTEFLESYFLLDIDSSQQVANAMLYFTYVQEEIEAIYDENINLNGGELISATIDANNDCRRWQEWYSQEAELLLNTYIRRATASKQSFAIVDGLKIINENMEELSLEFQMTFPLFFKKMNNALPCYAHQCI
jgi:hypothetical protein